MRINAEERRMMDRRLKCRVSPADRSGLSRAPKAALIVVASVWLTPEALAKVASKEAVPKAEISAQNTAPNEDVKSYSDEELSETMPTNPVRGLDQRLMQELNGLLSRMAKNQSGGDQKKAFKKLKTKTPSTVRWKLSLAALKTPPKGKTTNPDALRKYMLREAQRAVSEKVRGEIGLLSKIRGGLSLNLDFTKLFSGKNHNASPQRGPSGRVRYGLVLKDIEPDPSAPKRAAIADTQSELRFAGHADVEWTIGPLNNDGISLQPVESLGSVERKQKKRQSVWSWLRLPKPAFSGRVKPEGISSNLAKVDGNKLPGWTVQLEQTQGWYELLYKMKPNGEKKDSQHTFKIPIAGNFSLGRRFDDNWEVVRTSAYNVLIDKNAPLVSVHYLNVEERYAASAKYGIDGHNFGLGAKGRATGKAKHPKERYKVSYDTHF